MSKHVHGIDIPIVQAIKFPESANGNGIDSIKFITSLNGIQSESLGTSEDHNHARARVFVLQPPHEYVVCVRLHEFHGTMTGIQVQTNLGRRSKFYGMIPSEENKGKIGIRYELYAPSGEAIIDLVKLDSVAPNSCSFSVKTVAKPYVRRKKLRRLLLLPSVRTALLKVNESGRSTASHFFRGGRKAIALHAVRHGLAGKMLSAGEDGDALVRLILDGEDKVSRRGSTLSSATTRRMSSLLGIPSSKHPEQDETDDENDDEITEESIAFPPSILRAMCEPGPHLEHSVMDLLSAGRERDGRPPLIRILFDSGIAKTIFRHVKGHKSLAELMLTPDRIRGVRSLMQLMTDDEALDDPSRPCLMRSILIGEASGTRPSVLRLMFQHTPGKNVTSIMDELLKGEVEFDSIARRLVSESHERPVSLGRLFFSDTATGKPALGKYVFGGESETDERPSLMRLMVQGESRQQNSLLRLLLGYGDHSLMDLLTNGEPSLLDILLKGEDNANEMSLARLMLGTTFTIQNGRLVMGSALGSTSSPSSPSSLVSTLSIQDDDTDQLKRRLERGVTFAKACMLGEEDGGPGISVMRVLVMGEEHGQSVLRLLLTGEERNEISPLRIVMTGLYTVFVVAQAAADSTKEMQSESLLEIAMHPSKWLEAIQNITKAVVHSMNETHQAGGSWKESFEKLVEMGKEKVRSRDAWQENIAFLYTAFARVRSMGPEFARTWKKQWILVSREIRLTGERVKPQSAWKTLAPEIAALTENIADQQWQRVFLDVAHVIQAVERAAGRQNDKTFARIVSLMEEILHWAPKWF